MLLLLHAMQCIAHALARVHECTSPTTSRDSLRHMLHRLRMRARAAPLRENRGRRRRRRRGLEHARVARPRHDAAARDGADAHAEEAALRPARHDERPCGS